MTSFELFRLSKFNKNLYFIHMFILFSPKIDKCDKLQHFMQKNHIFFASNYGILTDIKIKLCK